MKSSIIDKICLTDNINDCCEGDKNCSECEAVLGELIAEHDKEIIASEQAKTIRFLHSLHMYTVAKQYIDWLEENEHD